MRRTALSLALLVAAPAAADQARRPGPDQACHDDYVECAETCDIDHGLDADKRKLRECVKRCAADRDECLSRFRFDAGPPPRR